MDSNKIYKEDIKDGNIIIRRAVHDDIDALVHISRISFPDLLIWCTEKHARKTWNCFIKSEFQEVWVCQFNHEVVAIFRLVKDINKIKEEIQELKPGLIPALCYLITRPRILYEKIIRKINNKKSTDIIYDKKTNELAKNSIWCYSVAVLPKMRNQSIGSKMISVCEKRGFESGYDSIKIFIKKNNKDSIRFYERLGFTKVAKIKSDLYIYIRMLSVS
ncbi:MAG: GNAT family N-acetyltransferase [Sedimentisphaerales bacterium]|nr:GNAT family N-acetyltransferase [Sedimentisphaerales bacterium]